VSWGPPWGYVELYTRKYTPLDQIDTSKTYLLIGNKTETMFPVGKQPAGFNFFWWDNTMIPHLRYPYKSKQNNKQWGRILYNCWNIPADHQPNNDDRVRVNEILKWSSGYNDVAELWDGCKDTKSFNGNMLIIRSSDRNYMDYHGKTFDQYFSEIEPTLKMFGIRYTIREKIHKAKDRINRQITDEIINGHYDCVLANNSAGAVEAAVLGIPVITTSDLNPARNISTPWEYFVDNGDVLKYTAEEIDKWITALCGYTFYKDKEIDNLKFLNYHPQGEVYVCL